MQEQPLGQQDFEFEMQQFPEGGAVGGAGSLLFGCFCYCIAFLPVIIWWIGMWKIFVKAGQPGWAAIIPFYNFYVLTIEVAKRDIIWFILWIIPCTSIIAHVVVAIDVARNFGKDTLYVVGLILFPFIFYPILGFGQAQYKPVPPTGGV